MKDNYQLNQYVRTIPDFPIEGIMFRDVTSVIQSPEGLKKSIDSMVENLKNIDFDLIVSPEARGFIFGVPVAYALNKGLFRLGKRENFLVKQLNRNVH